MRTHAHISYNLVTEEGLTHPNDPEGYVWETRVARSWKERLYNGLFSCLLY